MCIYDDETAKCPVTVAITVQQQATLGHAEEAASAENAAQDAAVPYSRNPAVSAPSLKRPPARALQSAQEELKETRGTSPRVKFVLCVHAALDSPA